MGLFDKMGNMMDMMGKLKETQKKVEQAKNIMACEFQKYESKDNQVEFEISTLGQIRNLKLTFKTSQEEFTKILEETLNNAIKSSQEKYEKSLAEIAKEGMPF